LIGLIRLPSPIAQDLLSSKSRTKIILSLQVLIAAIKYWKHPGPAVLIQADEDTSPSTSVRSQVMEMLANTQYTGCVSVHLNHIRCLLPHQMI
jgi:hypothetical protein